MQLLSTVNKGIDSSRVRKVFQSRGAEIPLLCTVMKGTNSNKAIGKLIRLSND